MALRYGDRVMETTTTTGTGALTLAAAVTGFQRFSAIPSIATSDTVYYALWAVDSGGTPTGDWETGLGTYSAANELTRTTVQASSNAGAAVNLSAGTKRVIASPTATLIASLLSSITLTLASTVTQSGTPVATSVGFLGSPQMADQDDYTLALTDSGGHYYHVSGTPHTLTIPANASVAFPIGTVIAIVNENGAGAITLAVTTDTLRWGSSTGSRTIAADGTATLLKVTSTVWRLTGDGIT